MKSSHRCDIYYRSDAMTVIRVAAANTATRMGESQRRESLRLTISSDEIVAAD